MRFEDEKELEDLIVSFHAKKKFSPVTDEGYHKFLRQVLIKGYGVADIVAFDVFCDPGGVQIRVVIHELKNRLLNEKDVSQISRYFVGVTRYFEKNYGVDFCGGHEYEGPEITISIKGALVGSGYDGGDVCFLVDTIPWLDCYHFVLDVDGVKFEESRGWYKKDEPDSKYKFGDFDLDEMIQAVSKECQDNTAGA